MRPIKKTYEISVSTSRVWSALVNPGEIENWGAGPAKMEDKVGSRFKLWGCDIFGTNTKIETNKLLAQDWYTGDWEEPSKLEIKLSETNGKIKVALLHENVPDSEHDEIEDGWDRYYFGPMKEYLEGN